METNQATNDAGTETEENQAAEGLENEVVEEVVEDVVEDESEAPEGQEGEEGQEDEKILDNLEEVEYNGKNYNLPKELKDALMRQSDYTKKSTELARRREALEGQERDFKELQQVDDAYTAAQVHEQVLARGIAGYKDVDWQALAQQDPVLSQEHWIKYSQMMHEHAEAGRKLDTLRSERQSRMQRENAKRAEQAYSVLKRDIPEWGQELAAKLTHHAVTQLGFSDQELSSITDPRIVKLIHKDFVESKKVVKPTIKPVASVKGTGGRVNVDVNKLSDAEWMEARRKKQK